ncbi:MAG: DMT family transporter [Acidobacteria bacterium]|nr:DMT family transporter [Acidobacteriota bacterium]
MQTDADASRLHGVRPHLALLAVQIFFGTWPFFAKVVLRVVPSTGLVAFRVAGATLVLLLLQGSPRRLALARRSDYARLALYSLLGVVLNQLFFVKGLSLSTVINANLLGTLIPVFALVGSLTLGQESFRARVGLGVLAAAAGAAYLVDPLNADLSQGTTVGNLLLITNALCYGLYIALSRKLIRRYGALTVITWVFLLANLVTLPVGVYHLRDVVTVRGRGRAARREEAAAPG